ncbi:MAG TPA: hypothetical protein VMR33_07510 [Candidatus Baltobacteraceae bacterium]|nr:hypothetical protein [Candidatus Baltobacteraceae bacterium]
MAEGGIKKKLTVGAGRGGLVFHRCDGGGYGLMVKPAIGARQARAGFAPGFFIEVDFKAGKVAASTVPVFEFVEEIKEPFGTRGEAEKRLIPGGKVRAKLRRVASVCGPVFKEGLEDGAGFNGLVDLMLAALGKGNWRAPAIGTAEKGGGVAEMTAEGDTFQLGLHRVGQLIEAPGVGGVAARQGLRGRLDTLEALPRGLGGDAKGGSDLGCGEDQGGLPVWRFTSPASIRCRLPLY